MSKEEVINRIKWFLDESDCTPTYEDMQEILALVDALTKELDRLTAELHAANEFIRLHTVGGHEREAEPEPKDELRTTIDMLMDAEEQTRIGINPNDVEHTRSPVQILCRILEEYDKQRQEINRLTAELAASKAEIERLKTELKRRGRAIRRIEAIEPDDE